MIQWKGQNDEECNEKCQHKNIVQYEGGYSNIAGEIDDFRYCGDCGLPEERFEQVE